MTRSFPPQCGQISMPTGEIEKATLVDSREAGLGDGKSIVLLLAGGSAIETFIYTIV